MRKRLMPAMVLVRSVPGEAVPTTAGHHHYRTNPSGKRHLLAGGQTSISNPDHGGYHRFHVYAHKGAAEHGTLGNPSVTIALAC